MNFNRSKPYLTMPQRAEPNHSRHNHTIACQ